MNRKALCFAVLTVLLLCFIWGQSLMPRDASEGESLGIAAWLKPLLDPHDRIGAEAFHHGLRKTAHFTEFAALGFCACGFSVFLPWKKPGLRVPSALAGCVLAACVDEIIQCFIPGRGPGLGDVLLDSCGALFGIPVFLLALRLLQKHKKTAA